MSYSLVLNSSNNISPQNNQFKYNFIGGSLKVPEGTEIGISQITIPYSWYNVSSQLGNNTFQYYIPNSSNVQTAYTVTLPNGFYGISDINNVLQSKKGNFFSLALLYAGIGQRLGIPLMALNLPDNFAIAYTNPRLSDFPIDEHSALFFINPANKGAVFGRHEIDDFLNKLKIKPESYYYIPMHNIDAIILQLEYLILSYTKLGLKDKVLDLRIIQKSIRNG